MVQRMLRGLVQGFLFGLIFAWAETWTVFYMSRWQMEMHWSPFNPVVAELIGLSVVLCTVLGGLLGALPARLHVRGPFTLRHLLPLSVLLVAIATTPMFDQMFMMGVLSLGLAHVTSVVINRILRWKPRAVAAVPLLMAGFFYATIVVYLLPELEHGADPGRPKPPAGAPNVLWVVLDTVRADHLTPYGYKHDTTPNLQKLANEGVLFEKAYATGPWTVESHAGMFTGLYSAQHNCTHAHLHLDGKYPTVAGELTKAGYETALFGGNPWLDDYTGLARGFQHLYRSWLRYSFEILFVGGRAVMAFNEDVQDKGGKITNRSFDDFMAVRDPNRPFFAFVNYLEAHAPYHHVPEEDRHRFLPPGVTPKEVTKVSLDYGRRMIAVDDYKAGPREQAIARATYDGGIYNADRLLGELVEKLQKAGQLDNTLIIVNADHGEMFGEHDVYGHDVALYHPLIHVPLVMRLPSKLPTGQRVSAPVQLIDIFPTIFEMAGLEDRLPPVSGKSVLPVIAGQGDPLRPMLSEYYRSKMRPLVMEMKRHGFNPETFGLRSVVMESNQLIKGPEERVQLFDLVADPMQERSIAQEQPEKVQQMQEKLSVLDAAARLAQDGSGAH